VVSFLSDFDGSPSFSCDVLEIVFDVLVCVEILDELLTAEVRSFRLSSVRKLALLFPDEVADVLV